MLGYCFPVANTELRGGGEEVISELNDLLAKENQTAWHFTN